MYSIYITMLYIYAALALLAPDRLHVLSPACAVRVSSIGIACLLDLVTSMLGDGIRLSCSARCRVHLGPTRTCRLTPKHGERRGMRVGRATR